MPEGSTGRMNPFRMNPPQRGRGGFMPPRKWLNGMRNAPRGSRNPVRDDSCYRNIAGSDCAFCALFFVVGRQIASARRKADARTSDRWALAPGGGRDLVGVKFW